MANDVSLLNSPQIPATSFAKAELPQQTTSSNVDQVALNTFKSAASTETSSASSLQAKTVKVAATENKSSSEISETKSSENIATGDELDNTVALPENMALPHLIEKLDSKNITLSKLDPEDFAEFSKAGYETRFNFPKHSIQSDIIVWLSKTIDEGAIPDDSYVIVKRNVFGNLFLTVKRCRYSAKSEANAEDVS